jgi:hypothetical protein
MPAQSFTHWTDNPMPPPPGTVIDKHLMISIDNGVLEFLYDEIQNVTVNGSEVNIVTNNPARCTTIRYESPAMAFGARSTIRSAIHIWNHYGQ